MLTLKISAITGKGKLELVLHGGENNVTLGRARDEVGVVWEWGRETTSGWGCLFTSLTAIEGEGWGCLFLSIMGN